MIERMESQESMDGRSCCFVKFLDNVGMGYTRSRFDEGAPLLLDTIIASRYCRCCLSVGSSFLMQDMVLENDSICVVLCIIRFLPDSIRIYGRIYLTFCLAILVVSCLVRDCEIRLVLSINWFPTKVLK